MPGEMQAIITVRAGHLDTNASLSTRVSFEARKGTCASRGSPMARMHSFSANKDLLICAPSTRLWRMLDLESAALSDPAKSTSVTFPWMDPPPGCRRKTAQTACDLEESRLMAVAWVVRRELPNSMHWSMASGLETPRSVSPAIWTSFLASSRVSSRCRLLRRS